MASQPKKSKPPATAQPPNQGQLHQLQAWQGPLPPPGALQQFDAIIPNGAERIMQMCEKEQAARLENDGRESKLRYLSILGGKIVGAIALLVCIAAALWTIHLGADWRVTVAFLSLPLLSVVGKLITDYSKR